ncbi:MAG: prephenate dehydrogenase/arogenate dehydrogenase family protein [Haloarculaceae archaeon]
MDALVVGAGTMGRWLGRCLAEGTDWAVAFADRDPGAASAAAAALDGARTADLAGDERFDLVCVAVPISATEAAIAEHAPRAGRAILDVSGVMVGPVRAMAEHAPDCERASFHPLFAPSNEPGNVAVVGEGGPTIDAVREVLADRGNAPFETTPEEHDEAMRTVQARAHAAVLAYALAAEEVDERFHTPVSADLAAVADRVTGNEPSVYAEIQATFGGADDVAEAARQIAEADGSAFERLYREASGGGEP